MLRFLYRIEIKTISFQICLQNKFLTSGSGRTEYMQIGPNARIYMCTHVHLNNYTLPSPGISSLTGGPALTPTRQLLTQVTLAEWGERDIPL